MKVLKSWILKYQENIKEKYIKVNIKTMISINRKSIYFMSEYV